MPKPSLDRLSEREEALLRLLAKGHTVKSAAQITGDSEHAANELLRSARRKLGVSSSREAARLLDTAKDASQKNCDKKIGIEACERAGPNKGQLAIGGIMLATFIAIPTVLLSLGGEFPLENSADVPDAPQVVATYPAHGAEIPPGPFELTITFDRPMLDQYVIYSPNELNDDQMKCIGAGGVKHSEDRRSFAIQCEAVAGSQHTIAFGSNANGFFKDDAWSTAAPYVQSFNVASESLAIAASSQ